MELQYRRPDGTFVALVDGLPYHVIKGDAAYWADAVKAAKKMGDKLPLEPDPEPEPMTRLPFAAFLELLTDAEQVNLAKAAMTDAKTKLWYDRAVASGSFDLTDAGFPAGLQMLADNGIITQDRARALGSSA